MIFPYKAGDQFGNVGLRLKSLFSSDYVMDLNGTHVELASKAQPKPVHLWAKSRSNLSHLVFSKLAHAVTDSMRVQTFYRGIHHVVVMRAKPQMIWAYTRSVVAGMTNKHAFWNWTIVQFKRISVGLDILIQNIESSIASILIASPFPAIGAFAYVRPEQCLGAFTSICVGARSGTKPTPIRYFVWLSKELRRAERAIHDDAAKGCHTL